MDDVVLPVDARTLDGVLHFHPVREHVDDDLHDRTAEPRRARAADDESRPAALEADARRHHRRQPLAGLVLPLTTASCCREEATTSTWSQRGNASPVLHGADLLFVLPVGDVCILPLANVTTEQLARYLSNEIVDLLPAEAQRSLHAIEVHVEETPGQRATYRRRLRPA